MLLISVGSLSAELPVVLLTMLAHQVDDAYSLVVVGQNLYLAQSFHLLLQGDIDAGLHAGHDLKSLLAVADSRYYQRVLLLQVGTNHEQSFVVGRRADLRAAQLQIGCRNGFTGRGVIHLAYDNRFSSLYSGNKEQET